MDRIFCSSGFYSKKWDENRGNSTYGQITIDRAMASCIDVYEPKRQENGNSLAMSCFGNN